MENFVGDSFKVVKRNRKLNLEHPLVCLMDLWGTFKLKKDKKIYSLDPYPELNWP